MVTIFALPLDKYLAARRAIARKASNIVGPDPACLARSEALWLKQYYEHKVTTDNGIKAIAFQEWLSQLSSQDIADYLNQYQETEGTMDEPIFFGEWLIQKWEASQND